MNVKQIALEVEDEMLADELTNVKHRLPEFLRRCLAKLAEGVEPVAFRQMSSKFHCWDYADNKTELRQDGPVEGLYTAEALVAVQQQTAEACAKLLEDERFSYTHDELWRIRTEAVEEIRSGKWREYL